MAVTGVSTFNTSSVKFEASYQATSVSVAAASEKASEQAADEAENKVKTDGFEKSEPRQDVGYGNIAKGLSAEQVQQLNDQRLGSLKSMVEKLISQQAGKVDSFDLTSVNVNISVEINTASVSGISNIQDIYEDETWGVDAMASKLMDMAISLSGGDSSKAETLLAAVQKGFDDATSAWGDELPGVCKATLDEVKNRFAYWQENGSLDGYEFQGYTRYDD